MLVPVPEFQFRLCCACSFFSWLEARRSRTLSLITLCSPVARPGRRRRHRRHGSGSSRSSSTSRSARPVLFLTRRLSLPSVSRLRSPDSKHLIFPLQPPVFFAMLPCIRGPRLCHARSLLPVLCMFPLLSTKHVFGCVRSAVISLCRSRSVLKPLYAPV